MNRQFAVGDKVESIIGTLQFKYGNWRVVTSGDLKIVSKAAPIQNRSTFVESKCELTIASYNVENLFAGSDSKKFQGIAKHVVD